MTKEAGSARDPAKVRGMFDSIAPRYDRANHVLSLGLDVIWRARVADLVASWQPGSVIDLATGSGDLALAIQRRLPHASVLGVDFSEKMLANARSKGLRQSLIADALHLPLGDESFQCATVAFGLRNMENWEGALREMRRVLVPNGHVVVLDFSMPSNPLLRALYRPYLHTALPLIAHLVTGRQIAYRYLGESIEKFPSGGAMIDLMETAGFSHGVVRSYSCGLVSIYYAIRP